MSGGRGDGIRVEGVTFWNQRISRHNQFKLLYFWFLEEIRLYNLQKYLYKNSLIQVMNAQLILSDLSQNPINDLKLSEVQ